MAEKFLCYVLVSACGRFLWSPGFRPIGNEIRLAGVPTWATKKEAQQAAELLRREICLEAKPARLALP